ncbi:MAG: hypothetical protein SFY80_15680 [Verrucomicrobiota bacterium]|nr:hypothetical protein [Verrucomicrobiota bacterium]
MNKTHLNRKSLTGLWLAACLLFTALGLSAQTEMKREGGNLTYFRGAFIQQTIGDPADQAVGLKALLTLGEGTYENLNWGTPVLKERSQIHIAATIEFLPIVFIQAPPSVVETHTYNILTSSANAGTDALVLQPGNYTVLLTLNGESVAKTMLVVRDTSPEPPTPSYWVSLKPTVDGTTATVHATITFPSGGNTVDWGTVSTQNNQLVATIVVTPPEVGIQIPEVIEHTYELGTLEPGSYFFTLALNKRRLASVGFHIAKPKPPQQSIWFKSEPVRNGDAKLTGTLFIVTDKVIDADSFGSDDLLITAEDGRTLAATYVDHEVKESMPMQYVAHYAISAPNTTGWTSADVGIYSVSVPKGAITADSGAIEFGADRVGMVIIQLPIIEDPKPVRGVGLSINVTSDSVAQISAKVLLNRNWTMTDWGVPELVDDCVNPYMDPMGMPVKLNCLQITATAAELSTTELSANKEDNAVMHEYAPMTVEPGMYQVSFLVNGVVLATGRFHVNATEPPPAPLGFKVRSIAEPLTTAGMAPYEFLVVYQPLEGTVGAIDTASLGNDDIVIVGLKNEKRMNARFVSIVQAPLIPPVLPPDITPPVPVVPTATAAVYVSHDKTDVADSTEEAPLEPPYDPAALVVKYAVDAPEAGWTNMNNGHYGLNLAVDGVTYNEGTELRPRGIGELTVRIAGEEPPPPPNNNAPIIFAEARNVFVTPVDTEGQPSDYAFRLFVIDRSGVDAATVTPAVITVKRYVRAISEKQMDTAAVTEPVTETLTATLGEVTVLDETASVVQATYTLAAPDGSWDTNDNGHYVVFAPADVIKDTDGNTFAGGPVGAFSIMIYAPAADSEEVADGWFNAPFMGYFRPDTFPWFFHGDHGWWFGAQSSKRGDAAAAATANDWVWDKNLSWLFVAREVYPWMYSAEKNEWLWYSEGSRTPRYFWGSVDREWHMADPNN